MIKDFGIYFDEKKELFTLQLENSTYVIGIVNGYLGHVYFGKKLRSGAGKQLLRTDDFTYLKGAPADKCTFMDAFHFEYSTAGTGDFRYNCLEAEDAMGHTGSELIYKSHSIYKGSKALPGLPAAFGTEADTETLEIVLSDEVLGLEAVLIYTIFEGLDCVARSVLFRNTKDEKIVLNKAASASIELDNKNFEVISLHGSWAREHIMERRPIGHGRTVITSTRGISSHQDHPFIALVTSGADEKNGEVYGMSFVYSGNFEACAEVTQHDSVRLQMGISPYNFRWNLEAGESFYTPQVLLTYSSDGIGAMSRTYHDVIRKHIIRSSYLHKKRPILINNWEATYFDFNMDKLVDIAREAKKSGIEMLVMDDGWFGKRNSDNCSLGDWKCNTEKLPEGLKGLVDRVNELGMKFGIWLEPEMVSPDSDLYRAHPDYAFQIPGREAALARTQYVLDLSRKEVVDYVYDSISEVLHSANIEYVKWDMNRPLTDIGSFAAGANQGELMHRYMLGVYSLQERLITEFPELLIENCSSGGARFDPGMLYYSPQIWCSDDTDAMERLSIQEGTSLIYPLSAIGAHVSDCPNHAVGRVTPFETRGYVALSGTFGYELDVTRIPEADRAMIPQQVADYHKYNELVREGDFYRLLSVDSGRFSCWQVAAKDKSETLLTYIQKTCRANSRPPVIKLQGLDKDALYRLEGSDELWYGDDLMEAGFIPERLWGDAAGRLYHFIKAEEA